jgi:hypothetical protein
MSEAASENLGPYRLDRLISSGLTTQVWLATGPEGEVAVKVARTEAHRAALAHEVRALQLGRHPGLVRVLRVADDHGWVALEHIRGAVSDRWATGRPPADVLAVLVEVLHTLKHLHSQGVSNVNTDRVFHRFSHFLCVHIWRQQFRHFAFRSKIFTKQLADNRHQRRLTEEEFILFHERPELFCIFGHCVDFRLVDSA